MMKSSLAFGLFLYLAVLCRGVPRPYDFSYIPVRESPDADSDEYGQFRGPRDTNCSCGWTYKAGGRIVGGREAGVNQFVNMVAIGYTDPKDKGQLIGVFCGGTIVTRYHVLTAAHCMDEEDNYADLGVMAGEHDISRRGESKYTTMHSVANIVVHPGWTRRTLLNDIAVVVLKDGIVFNDAVGPICLPNRLPDLVGQMVKVTGWGDTKFYGDSNVLMKVNLKVIDLKYCSVNYPTRTIPLDTRTQLCTYRTDRDSCQGDSGGPLTWLDPETNRYTLVGVVSYGTGCATTFPGVNTLVSHFLPWVQQTIKATAPKPVSTCSKI